MKTNVAYQDDLDVEECEVYIDGADVQHLPLIGESVVVASQDDDETPGVLHVVKDRLWTVFPEADKNCPAVQHVTVLLERVVPVAERTSRVLATVADGEDASFADRVDAKIARAFTALRLSGRASSAHDAIDVIEQLRDDVRDLLESSARDVVDTLIADVNHHNRFRDLDEETRASWLLIVRGAVKP